MKLLWIDTEGESTGLDVALRAKRAGHDVRFWQPPQAGTGQVLPYGEGLINRIVDWEDSIDWAELTVINGNSKYENLLAPYVGKGYPMVGANPKGAQLELDRAKGQEVLERFDIPTLPYEVVTSPEEAIAYIKAQDKAIVAKPWGGAADKAMTFVADSPEDAIFTIEKWQREGKFSGQLMLQEKVDGVEFGISGMFGPGGWCEALEESFEHKKLMPGNWGPNTGEMGTVIRHVSDSKLFDLVLAPLTPYLHEINYIGDCSVNCIVDNDGTPWPLEFTCRWGHPDLALRIEALAGDPVEWLAALARGEDEFIVTPQVVVGVVMAHGDFPRGNDPLGTWSDYPIHFEDDAHVHWQMVKRGKSRGSIVTAGNYVAVATARGPTVSTAAEKAYQTVDTVTWPGDIIVRNDIGGRLKKDLPKLQKLGFCVGMEF